MNFAIWVYIMEGKFICMVYLGGLLISHQCTTVTSTMDCAHLLIFNYKMNEMIYDLYACTYKSTADTKLLSSLPFVDICLVPRMPQAIFIDYAVCYNWTFSVKLTWWSYRKISNIRRTKFQTLNVSRLVLQLSLPNPMKPGVKSRMKM